MRDIGYQDVSPARRAQLDDPMPPLRRGEADLGGVRTNSVAAASGHLQYGYYKRRMMQGGTAIEFSVLPPTRSELLFTITWLDSTPGHATLTLWDVGLVTWGSHRAFWKDLAEALTERAGVHGIVELFQHYRMEEVR